jgi:hypothetical protein
MIEIRVNFMATSYIMEHGVKARHCHQECKSSEMIHSHGQANLLLDILGFSNLYSP